MSDNRRKDKYENQQKRFKNHEPRYRKDMQQPRKARIDPNDLIETIRFSRSDLKLQARETINIMEKKSISKSITLLPDDLQRLSKLSDDENEFDTQFEIELETTLGGIYRVSNELKAIGESFKLGVLNFASAKNPGGGFQNGSMAQEESLAYATGLYQTIKDSPIYKLNRTDNLGGLYHDTVIFSPDVLIIRNLKGKLLDQNSQYTVNILTVPAVNATLCATNRISKKNVKQALYQRMDYLLAVALDRGITHLILGSWGCGVFDNQIEDISYGFIDLLTNKYQGAFKGICFSIMQKSHEACFSKQLDRVFN